MKLLSISALMGATLSLQAIAQVNVCELPRSLRSDIAQVTGSKPCWFITDEDLALVKTVSLNGEALAIDGDQINEDTLVGFTGLETLILEGINVPSGEKSFFRDLVSLKGLYLNSSSFSTKGAFQTLSKVETLKIRDAYIDEVSPDMLLGMDSLKDFSMNYSRVVPGELFSHSPHLERIELNNNSADVLPENLFAGLKELKSLDLFGLRSKVLPEKLFAGLRSLENLSLLGAKQIRSVPELLFQDLVKLQHLRLDTANIETLPANLFSNMTEIRGIYMGYGILRSLPPGIFDNLDHLAIIEMYHNNLRDLPPGIFSDLPSLILASIYGNDLTEEEQIQLKEELGDRVFL